MCSFIDLLYETPRLLEVLPPTSLKSVSATCKSLRTSFRARVSIIHLSCPEDALTLRCATWPQLVLVVCTSDSELRSTHFSAGWQYMLGLVMRGACFKSAVMVVSHSLASLPVIDLSKRHCTALADFADKHSHDTKFLRLQGPCLVGRAFQALAQGPWLVLDCLEVCKAPQLGVEGASHLCHLYTLTDITFADCCLDAAALMQLGTGCPGLERICLSNNQFDANTILGLPRNKWHQLWMLELSFNTLGPTGMQHIASCSWPEMMCLSLHHTGIDEHDLKWLAQASWPTFRILNLAGNIINAVGSSHLLHGNWPYLRRICLSAEGIDEEARSLLGIAAEPTSRIDCQQHAANPIQCSEICIYGSESELLPQFPSLEIVVAHNVSRRCTQMIRSVHQLLELGEG